MVRTSGAARGQKAMGRSSARAARARVTRAMRRRAMRPRAAATRVVLALLVTALVKLPVRAEAAASSSCLLEVRGGALSGRLLAAPLDAVMREVSRLTGARIDWLGEPGGEPITLAFDSLPADVALARILAHRAHLVTFAGAASIPTVSRVWIGSRVAGAVGGALASVAPVAADAPVAPAATDAKGAAIRALDDPDEYVRLEAVRRLAELGDAEQDIEALAEVAVQDADDQVRAAALLAIEQSQGTPVAALLEIARRDASVALRVRAARVLAIAAAAEDPAAEAALVEMAALDQQLRTTVADAVAAVEALYY